MIACQRWRQTWCVGRWRLSPPSEANLHHSRQSPRPQQFPSYFSIGSDPIKLGLVASLNRPGGNITGVNFFQSELGAKRIGLLRVLLPNITAVGMLINPHFAEAETHARDAREAALSLGLQLHVARASTADEFDEPFQPSSNRRTERFCSQTMPISTASGKS